MSRGANDLRVLIGRRDIEMRQPPGLVHELIACMREKGEGILPRLIIGPLSGGNKVLWKETTGAGEQIALLRSTLEARRMYTRLCFCTNVGLEKRVFVKVLKNSPFYIILNLLYFHSSLKKKIFINTCK